MARVLWGWPQILRGDGEGMTFYLGRRQGAPYVALHLRGFTGWSSAPLWMPGGWEFYSPTLYYGRLFMDRGGYRGLGRVLVPAKIVHAKRMLRRSYREAMREEPMQDGS